MNGIIISMLTNGVSALTASADSARRRLSRSFGIAALFVSVGLVAGPPPAGAYDGTYYAWCKEAVGGDSYCCNQAGGVWTGGGCTDSVPSQAPVYVPPDSGILVP